jgi:S1-C subfamily serine protease
MVQWKKGEIMIQLLLTLIASLFNPTVTIKAPTTHYHGYVLNQQAIKKAKTFTVLISAEGFGGIERGTGVLVDSMTVLTCAHVAAANNDQMWVITYPGKAVYYTHVKKMDESKDLALLSLDRPVKNRVFATFQDYHYDGEPITIIGNILGSMKWFVSYGIISGESNRDLYTDGLLLGGNSGGPWVNEKGEVVALSDWGLANSKGVSLGVNGGISAKTIHEFLKAKGIMEILQMMLGGK